MPLQSSSAVKSKKSVLQGANSQQAIHLQNQNVYSGPGPIGSSYKRIVNIYSMQNYKKQRKSMAPEARLHLNHSMLPPGGLPYEEFKKANSVESL